MSVAQSRAGSVHFRSTLKELLMASLVFVELRCEIEKYFLPEGVNDFCLPICYSVFRTWLRVMIRAGNVSPRQLNVSRVWISMDDGQL